MTNPKEIYNLIQDRMGESGSSEIEQLLIGLTWTLCQVDGKSGLAMSPGIPTRTLPWSGSLSGTKVDELKDWLISWKPYHATVSMAVANAVINSNSSLLKSATPINMEKGPGNLAVFEHFAPLFKDKKVAVVGRYPGLDLYEDSCDMTVIERNPGSDDLPDMACEYILPEAEWVFLTGTSIPNKTFPRLVDLARDANLVLMGPTVPWLPELAEFGIDFVAGVNVTDSSQLYRTIAEGGGMRIFGNGVSYSVADLGAKKMAFVKEEISSVVAKRESLKSEMSAWIAACKGRFPKMGELEALDNKLSQLDSQFKRMWDIRSDGLVLPA